MRHVLFIYFFLLLFVASTRHPWRTHARWCKTVITASYEWLVPLKHLCSRKTSHLSIALTSSSDSRLLAMIWLTIFLKLMIKYTRELIWTVLWRINLHPCFPLLRCPSRVLSLSSSRPNGSLSFNITYTSMLVWALIFNLLFPFLTFLFCLPFHCPCTTIIHA